MKIHTKTDIVKFLNKELDIKEILLNEKGEAWIDNGGGSDNDFIELSVEHLIKLVKKAYIRGVADCDLDY